MPQENTNGVSPSLRRRVLSLVVFTVFLDLVGYGIVIPLFPLYVKEMNASVSVVGLILACFSLTQLVATPILGRLSDKYGRRRIILISLAGNALSMILFALAVNVRLLPLFFASRIIAGATAGNLSACQAAIADVTAREERAGAMGLLGAGIGLGLVLGPALGGLLAKLAPWAPPIGAAAMAVADLVLTFFLMPETRWKGASGAPKQALDHMVPALRVSEPSLPPKAAPQVSLWDALRERRMAGVLVLYFLTFMCITNLQVSLTLLAQQRMGWSEEEAGWSFALFGLMGLIIQGGLIGRLVRVFGELVLVIAGAVLNLAGMLLIGFSQRPATLLVGLVIFGAGVAITNPSLSSLASRFARDEQQGAVLGFAQSAGGLARTVGPIWSGHLFDEFGSTAPFISGAVASLLSFLVGVSVKIGGRTTPSAPLMPLAPSAPSASTKPTAKE
jgi:DHA1 family tetracycline resistance protein-like MFS transporter